MQIDASHCGISSAMLRFSKRAVPVGQQPSSGIALTGIRSPSLASRRAVTFWMKSRAHSENDGGTEATAALSGTFGSATSCNPASAASTAA